MNDLIAIPRHPAAPHRSVRARPRASLRAQQGTHPGGLRPWAWRPHLAERAYAAELMHAERAGSAVRPGLEPARDRAEARP